VLDRGIGLARPNSDHAADEPAAPEIPVESQRAVDQGHCGPDVLAEIGQREGGVRQDTRVVASHFQRPPCEIHAFQRIGLRMFAPIVDKQPKIADCGIGERGPVTRIAIDRLFKQTELLVDLGCRR